MPKITKSGRTKGSYWVGKKGSCSCGCEFEVSAPDEVYIRAFYGPSNRRRRCTCGSFQMRIFRGVSIKTNGEFVCSAATVLQRRRYLTHEAPYLPLAECTDIQNCRCVYKHFDDRRTHVRREPDDGLPLKDHPNSVRQGVG